MALTKVTGQVINDTTGLVVGVTTVGGGLSATDGFFSGIVTAVGDASFSGNVSVGGTLTYEDVTNIDAVGLVTARNGIVVGSGITLSKDGDVFFTGIATGNGSGLTALNATQLTSGTIPDARFPATLPAVSGANLTGIAATDNVRTGILDVAGISTFRNTVNIGAAVTISESGIEASGIGITVANINGGQFSHRNVIINGACLVAQRDNLTTAQTGYGAVDRFQLLSTGASRFTLSKNDGPGAQYGLPSALKFETTTADSSIAATDYMYLDTRLEGQDIQRFQKGSSDAKQFTLQFWIKLAVTGTYVVQLFDADNSRHVVANYTVNSANTWEKKIITFPADTTGSFDNDNARSLDIRWHFMGGSNYRGGTQQTTWGSIVAANMLEGMGNAVSSTGDNFITGMQLEVGPEATAFEHRSYAEQLQQCLRYYEKQSVEDGNGHYATLCNGYRSTSTRVVIEPRFRVPKRAVNADFEYNGPFRFYYYNNSEQTIDSFTAIQNSQFGLYGGYKVLDRSGGVGGADGVTFRMEGNGDSSAYIAFSSEL